jgi:hypothetical protein
MRRSLSTVAEGKRSATLGATVREQKTYPRKPLHPRVSLGGWGEGGLALLQDLGGLKPELKRSWRAKAGT